MNGFMKYLLGLISGVIITAVFFTATGNITIRIYQNKALPEAQTPSETVAAENTDKATPQPQSNRPKKKINLKDIIEIGVPGNYIQLYRGMNKDEVLEILGKPKSSSISTILGDISETWFYGEYFEGTNILNLIFENGKLSSINQF